ncbi:translocation/assembly module TamB domain-containing protein [Candidatus Electronema sp. TJ]|uniref:translocation/assembly module TamB domain-containing protein n=1 Tax=Candidatus Electronema sp. TJ TaxID=3401573 RepID=UPI003AA862DD
MSSTTETAQPPAPAPAVSAFRRWLRRLTLCGLTCLLLISASLAFLIGTEHGLELLVRTAGQLAGPYFSAEEAQGRLLDRWRLGDVRIHVKDEVEITVRDFSFSWQPLALFQERTLHVNKAAATGLTVRILDSPKKERKVRKRIVLPELSLPLGVRIDELRVAASKIVADDGEDALVIHEAVAQAAAQDDHAEVLRLHADTSQFGADLSGKVRFTGAWPVQAGGSWSVPDHGINKLVGTLAAQGDFSKAAVQATMTSPAKVTLQGQVTDIFNELHWRAAAESGHFRLSDLKINVPVDGTLRIVEASGTVKSYRGTVAAEIHHEGYPTVQAEAKVEAADYTGLAVDYLTVRHEASELTLRGRMRWKGGFSWQAELAAKDIDPALAAADWPGKINGHVRSSGLLAAGKQSLELHLDGVQGELRGQPFSLGGKLALADKKLTIDGLELDSALAKARISGTADAAKQISLSVQAEAADLAAFTPEAGGSLKLEGSAAGPAENAAVTLHVNGSQLKFRNHALSALEVTAAASLTDSGGGLTAQEISVLADGKAALQLRGSLGWKNGLSWQAELKAAGLDPGLLAPDWPGAINAELRSQGSRTAEKLAAAVQIDKLDGSLRGFPLQGSGKAAFDGTTVTVDGLRLHSGSTFVQASGTADIKQALALSFKAGSDNLASLAPAAAGSFQLEGAVSGTAQQPALSLTASGSKLRFQDYSLKELKAAVKADVSPSGQVDADIQAKGLQAKQEQISTASLLLKGSAAQHRLDLAVAGSPGTLRLAAAGGWQEQQWQGQLAEMELENKQFGTWKTARPADLLLSAQRCSLSGFALAQDKVRAAVSGSWQQGAGWQAQAELEQLSLDLLKKWQLPVPESFPAMQGVLAVSAAAQSAGAVPQQAELTVSLPELALTAENYDENDGKTTWRWRDNQIAAKLKNDTLHLTARTTFQDGSTATLDATASNCGDFRQPEQMPLSGKAVINIMDIAPLTQLTGYAVQPQGGFGGTVALRGTAAKPELDGLLALKQGLSGEGRIHVPAAGIDLRALRLAVAGDGSRNQFDLAVRSGPGQLRAQGVVSRSLEKPELEAAFSITGENFQAAALPEYNVLISPDLKLQHSGKGTVLSGTIAVPKARIAPKGFSGAVSSSKDVVMVDGGDGPAANSLPFSASLALELGRDVAVDAFGFRGFLDGGLKISAKPEQTVTALGAIYLRDASVDFEGVALQLNEGRIFYQGGPIDQPGLDIRASKTVNKVEAGIHLTGSVDDMNIKLFSDTPMQDSEILSWLLSGQNSMSSSSREAALSPAAAALSKVGGGALLKSVNPLAAIDMEDFLDVSIGGGKDASDVSLVMGKEIYKDLYISYGKDLTGEGGSFKARYDLKYGFSVESETTAKTTGADLMWSLER